MDQYLAVLYPLEYNTKVNRGTSLKLIFSVWALGFFAATVASSQLISAGHRSPWLSCRDSSVDLSILEGSPWLLIASSAFFMLPVLVLTGIYLRIFAAASKNSRGLRRNSFHQLSLLNLHPAPLLESEKEAADLEDEERETQEPEKKSKY